MGILDIFRKPKKIGNAEVMQELGGYNAYFTSFGTDIYKSEVIRSAIRPIAEHTSKANARCTNSNVENILNTSPNVYMNGKDFLAKVRTWLELKNTAFIYINRDDKGHAISFYPVPYSRFEAIEYANGLFVRFYFANGSETVMAWDDLAVVRKDYNKYDIAGDENDAILSLLELINTTEQGVSNAVKSTANLRGLLKSTKGMLSDDDRAKQRDAFIRDYMNISNEGGIAMLDSTMDFTPIKLDPMMAGHETLKEFRENIYRYYGISDAIITSNYTEAQMEAFYDSRIEPFLVALSLELTRKIFTERERAFGASVVYESNRLQYTSNKTKLDMVALVDRGALTPNEWRMMFNLAPVEGGDKPIRRLDTAEVDAEPTEEPKEGEEND